MICGHLCANMHGKVCFYVVFLCRRIRFLLSSSPTDASGFKNYDPKLGLNYLEFRKTFLDKDTAGLLETDLNHDYEAFLSFVRGRGSDDDGPDKDDDNTTSNSTVDDK